VLRRALSAGVIGTVGLVWIVLVTIALGGVWSSFERPSRRTIATPAPSLAALTRAIALAGPFIDGLYAPRADGTAAMAEYYGLPVRVRLDDGPWLLPGEAENRVRRVSSVRDRDVSDLTFRTGDAVLTGRLTVDWRAAPAPVRITFVPRALRGARRATLALQERPLVAVGPGDAGRRLVALVPGDRRALFRSFRFTVRHATNDGEQYELLRGRRDRAARLGATARAGGFPAGRDIYAALWNASGAWGDDMPVSPAAYADCDHRLVPDDATYLYRSKTCALPSRAYLWLSTFDPLVGMLHGLHVLQRHGDPGRRYDDLDRDGVSVAAEIGRWERLFRAQDGMPRCSPASCDLTWSSGVRTAVFGALETELGYGHDDRISRTYADRTAAVVLGTQIRAPGVMDTAYGTLQRPLQVGGFAIAWRPGGRLGFSPKLLARSIDRAADALSMPKEYTGFVASNAESALAAYAFLVRYRCRKYAVGCRGQFAMPRARRAARR
jgi:hypothetical protein